MNLSHYEFITSCSILVGSPWTYFQGCNYKKFLLDEHFSSSTIFCNYSLENMSMDSNKDATACYELIMA